LNGAWGGLSVSEKQFPKFFQAVGKISEEFGGNFAFVFRGRGGCGRL